MTASGEFALAAEGLAKRYGRRNWALQGIDVAIPVGGITALVGPNAAGKSTLIRTWVGFERPTRGRVSVLGVDPRRHRSRALRAVGYVPQSPALYDGLTVEDHLLLAQKLRPWFDRAGAARRLTRLAIPLGQLGRDLSGGQQAQVALALALATGAEVFLLDEPLADLDPLARREFLHVLMEAVRTAGATALLSSHIVTDVEQTCDRMLVLGVGRVLLDAKVADALGAFAVIGRPASAVGREVIGRFSGPSGETLALVRHGGGMQDARPASLEEVVLGHLAAGRVQPTLNEEPVQ